MASNATQPPSNMPPPPRNAAPTVHAPNPLATQENLHYLLCGPAATITLKSGSSPVSYTLPTALLATHAPWFTNEILGRMAARHAAHEACKKRKLSSNDPGIAAESTTPTGLADPVNFKACNSATPVVIELPDVETGIFCLFLKFVYQGTYPVNVDIRNPKEPTQQAGAAPARNANTVQAYAAPGQPQAYMLSTPPTPAATPPALAPNPPYPQVPISPTGDIPHSIKAWILGKKISAVPFMNYAANCIFFGIGARFTLTPGILHYVWERTTLTPQCALRRLLLDVLVAFWHGQQQNVVVRGDNWDTWWNAVLSRHESLNRGLLFGKSGAALQVQNYYEAPVAPTNVRRMPSMRRTGVTTGTGAGRGDASGVNVSGGAGGARGGGGGDDGGGFGEAGSHGAEAGARGPEFGGGRDMSLLRAAPTEIPHAPTRHELAYGTATAADPAHEPVAIKSEYSAATPINTIESQGDHDPNYSFRFKDEIDDTMNMDVSSNDHGHGHGHGQGHGNGHGHSHNYGNTTQDSTGEDNLIHEDLAKRILALRSSPMENDEDNGTSNA